MRQNLADLIGEYKQSRKRLRKYLSGTAGVSYDDRSKVNSMIRDLTWDIFYMEHGYTMEESSAYGTEATLNYVSPELLDSVDPECAHYMLETQRIYDLRGIDEQVSVRMTLAALFNSLSKRQHEAVILRAEGFSEREAAKEMGITRRSVRRHLSRARKKLHDLSKNREIMQ